MSPITPTVLFSVAVIGLLYVGLTVPTERFITPKRGIGYALGIVGGSLMLLLFLYSARKRITWLKFLGPAARWFRYHMLLGVLGPLCILYHSNFGLGATNSNVALFSMLTVAASGLVGRYIYARIHHGLYGSKLTLTQLQQSSDGARAESTAFTFAPDLSARLQRSETRILSTGPRLPMLAVAKLINVSMKALRLRVELHAYIRSALRAAAVRTSSTAVERKRLKRSAYLHVDARLAATRRVAGFQAYERLFSLWHALHLPLIFILILAGIVHVVAVNIY
jgi:hypothetical protein